MRPFLLRMSLGLGLLMVAFWPTTQAQAQQQMASFQGQDILANSIVVVQALDSPTQRAAQALQRMDALRTDYDVDVAGRLRNGTIEAWSIRGDMEALLDELNRLPGVTAFPNYVFQRETPAATAAQQTAQDLTATDDPLLGLQYGLDNDGTFNPTSVAGADIAAFDAWNTTVGSEDVVLAIMDSGVDFTHEDLADNAWVNPGEDLNSNGVIDPEEENGIDDDGNGYVDDFHGWSAIFDDNSVLHSFTFDPGGSSHGTHVAGIAGAQGNNATGIAGVSQEVKILSVMFFDEFGFTNAFAILYSYQYLSDLMDSGVNVTAINQSWGGGRLLQDPEAQRFIELMTAYARDHAEHDAIWVISAGNAASNRDMLPFYSIPNNVPSPNVIAVASTNDAEELSGFSDFGVRTVDIGAPGSAILSTVPPAFLGDAYAFFNGTSMAAPHVAGALALAKAQYPNDDAYALIARVLGTAEVFAEYTGVYGEGGRLNAYQMVDPVGAGLSGLVPSHQTATFHNTFIDDLAVEVVGFTNASGASVDVTNVTVADDDGAFSLYENFAAATVAAGEAYGIPVMFASGGSPDIFTGTVTIATTGGDVTINLDGKEQGFGLIAIDPPNEDVGPVAFGTEITASFDITNNGTGPFNYGLNQAIFQLDLDASAALAARNQVTPERGSERKTPLTPAERRKHMDALDAMIAKALAGRDRKHIAYDPADGLEDDHLGEIIFVDSLNNPDTVAANWTTLAFGSGEGENETFALVDVGDAEVDNVFLAGDLTNGYLNGTVAVAVSPVFDFSLLSAEDPKEEPAYLMFDYAAELENFADFFFINVIVDGRRLQTLDVTDFGSLIADGNVYTALMDISHLRGLDDVEFWFIFNADGSEVGGFGALFDNVHLFKDEAAFFTDTDGGTVDVGGTETVTVTVRTELLPEGEFVLVTEVESDALDGFIDPPAHELAFSSFVANVAFDEDFIDLGVLERDAEYQYDFTATNVGLVDVDYEAKVFLATPDDEPGDDPPLAATQDAAHARFQEASDKAARPVRLQAQRDWIREQLRAQGAAQPVAKPRPGVFHSAIVQAPQDDHLFFAEDFQAVTPPALPDGWLVDDGSLGLGDVFESHDLTEVLGLPDGSDPFQVLGVANFTEDGFAFIRNNTNTIAVSPSFDLSEVADSEAVVLEFGYGVLMEPGWDFASVWLGIGDPESDDFELAYLGSSEDALFNDGDLYTAMMDITEAAGLDQVSVVFTVTTDASVNSGYAFFDDIAVYPMPAQAFIRPREGSLAVDASQEFTVGFTTFGLIPGDYFVVSSLVYEGELVDGDDTELFGSSSEQVASFVIENNAPVALDDTITVVAGDLVDFEAILFAVLSNDSDADGDFLFFEDATDPAYGHLKWINPLGEEMDEGGFYDPYLHYQAPLNYDGWDYFDYVISDGSDFTWARVWIEVHAEPAFMTGAPFQISLLEDETVTVSSLHMAAGVGGMNGALHVTGMADAEEVTVSHDADDHTLTVEADEDWWGQTTAMLYLMDDTEVHDSAWVSIVIAPVNDAPNAAFTAAVNGPDVTFTDGSDDAADPEGAIVAWDWDFDDGTTSDEANPVHQYTAVGTYTVSLTVTDNAGATTTTTESVEITTTVGLETEAGVPETFVLDQNYPNPFNPVTAIRFGLPEAMPVTVRVFNLLGQEVALLYDGQALPAGYHRVLFDAGNLASGVYLYQVRSADRVLATKKMVLLK